MDVDGEIKHLIAAVQRLGKPDADGKHVVTFGVLFDDDECANLFEVRRRAARFCVDAARRGALLSSRQPR